MLTFEDYIGLMMYTDGDFMEKKRYMFPRFESVLMYT